MKMNHQGVGPRMAVGTVGAGVTFALLAVPTPANAGADASILIPEPAEFIPALVAFLIIWALLAKFAWPSVLGMLDKRQKTIQDNLDEAEADKQKAADQLSAYDQKLADAQREADSIVADAKRDAEQERAEIVAKAQDEASKIISRAHEATENERRVAMNDLRDSVADISVEVAGKIIGEKLDDAGQKKLIEKYLAEVGDLDEH
ncbi:MAG: F0F1 ATP synthase subunit B [Atopobiaceae bacterium]|nr:F0F1 ATP synthase subunit B [Atopobiaceae bacterium]MCH4229236.1 F0F1 ATP synthase subunit B [Atopobiaceae bacterium]MCI1226840.1 F0F1 ATP synthase subunit B [Atopobiaceae bacterium]MCI1259739.1 F0F1 ATP synthase subunit B [Atopobiaceae bacterium]MDD3176275.1 F0F1 ATP synthase subunit B [Atopobiaceae bacterium]